MRRWVGWKWKALLAVVLCSSPSDSHFGPRLVYFLGLQWLPGLETALWMVQEQNLSSASFMNGTGKSGDLCKGFTVSSHWIQHNDVQKYSCADLKVLYSQPGSFCAPEGHFSKPWMFILQKITRITKGKNLIYNCSPYTVARHPCPSWGWNSRELWISKKANTTCVRIKKDALQEEVAKLLCGWKKVICQFHCFQAVQNTGTPIQHSSPGSESGAVGFPQSAFQHFLCGWVFSGHAELRCGWETLHKRLGRWRELWKLCVHELISSPSCPDWFVCRGLVASSNVISMWSMGYPWRPAGFLANHFSASSANGGGDIFFCRLYCLASPQPLWHWNIWK